MLGKVPGCAPLRCCRLLFLQSVSAADPVELYDKEPEGTSLESDGPVKSKIYNVKICVQSASKQQKVKMEGISEAQIFRTVHTHA